MRHWVTRQWRRNNKRFQMGLASYLRGGLVLRRAQVFRVALLVFLDYKLVQKRSGWTKSKERIDAMWEAAHERNGRRVYQAIVWLEGLWVKAGQYLSTRADVLPEAYIQRLKSLQDSLPPRPISEVYSTIKKQLGQHPNALFEFFDSEPLATASIAQVHRAINKDRVEVVVKVQHKGVRSRILQDLQSLRTIVSWVAWAEPTYDFSPVVDEWANEVPKELDFNTEANNTREVAKNLTGGGRAGKSADAAVDVLLPEVLQSSEKVLIMSYMEGWRLHEREAMTAVGVDTQAVVESITRSYAHQIYIDGFFNADPHPGNFLVSKQSPFKPILLDFGLTKRLSEKMKFALAKLLLAAAENDLAALLSSFAEMGLKLRMDMPDEAMAITSFFFRNAVPAEESRAQNAQAVRERSERLKKFEEKIKAEGGKNSLRRHPIDAFPAEMVFFVRVLNLLRGLSSELRARVVYLEVMRPFAEAILFSHMNPLADIRLGSSSWVYASPERSPLEGKMRQLLVKLGQAGMVLGAQVCVYSRGQMIVDTSVGVLGKYDPRPVRPDSLFSSFSATKGVTAALVHSLVDRSLVSFDTRVASVWDGFGCNGKEAITVADVLRHTAGLASALNVELAASPFLLCNWGVMLEKVALQTPEHPPGERQEYHSLTFGWLAGGIVEKVTGKSFKDVLRATLAVPLGVEDEFFIGIPAGVESRLATLAVDHADMEIVRKRMEALQSSKSLLQRTAGEDTGSGPWVRQLPLVQSQLPGGKAMSPRSSDAILPSIAQTNDKGMALALGFNALFVRRAVIPAANGHFSARALARFYAAMADRGVIPPPPPTSSSSSSSSSSPPSESKDETVSVGVHASDDSAGTPTSPPPSAMASRRPLLGFNARLKGSASILQGLLGGTGDRKGKSSSPPPSTLRDTQEEPESASTSTSTTTVTGPIFRDPRICDAFVARGAFSHLANPEWPFGLGYRRYLPSGAFGFSGVGGSLGYADPTQGVAFALTVNKLTSTGEVTAAVGHLICTELGLEVPVEFQGDGRYASEAPDMGGRGLVVD